MNSVQNLETYMIKNQHQNRETHKPLKNLKKLRKEERKTQKPEHV